jgi:hypothetical protein
LLYVPQGSGGAFRSCAPRGSPIVMGRRLTPSAATALHWECSTAISNCAPSGTFFGANKAPWFKTTDDLP